jgi:hypothetical protein
MVQSPSGLYQPLGPHQAPVVRLPPELCPQAEGFLVPSTPNTTSAADALICAPTPSDLGLPTVDLDEVIADLHWIPFEAAMLALSVAAAEIYHHQRDVARQLRVAREYHDAEMLRRIERFVGEDPSVHVIFDPRHLLALQRLLIVHGADTTRGLRATELHRLSRALVDLAEALPTSEPHDDQHDAIDLEGWTRYFAQSSAWYDEPYVLEAVVRAYTMFGEIAEDPDATSHSDRALVEERLREIYGLGLAEQVGVGLACAQLTYAVNPDVAFEERFRAIDRGFLAATALASREADAVSLLSATRAHMRVKLLAAGETAEDVAWDHSVLEASPFLRASDGMLRLSSPRLLVSWMTRGLHYRLLEAAGRGLNGEEAKKARSRFLTFTGALGEKYVHRLICSSLRTAERAHAVRIYGEVEFHIGKRRLDGPDVVIDAGPDLIMLEVCTSRMSRTARTGMSSDALIEFVKRSTAGKLTELADRMRDFLGGHLNYETVDRKHVRRIWPVLVLAGDGVMDSPPLWDYLRQTAPQAFVDDVRVRDPVICDLDDLEPLLALAEEGEHLPDLLGRFLASAYRQQPPRNWISHVYGINRRPSFVARQFAVATDAVRRDLFSSPPKCPTLTVKS